MNYFDLKGMDGCCHVVRTEKGVRVDHVDYELEGSKVMHEGLHIYSVCFESYGIAKGRDFSEWKAMDFEKWCKGTEGNPKKMRIEGKVYDVKGLDRSWPLPEIIKDGKVVGQIEGEYDIVEDTTSYKIKWL